MNFFHASAVAVTTFTLIFSTFSPAFSAGPTSISLLWAANFALLSKTAITDVPASTITGNVGASPISGAAIGVSCSEVTGTIYSVDAAGPLPCSVMNAWLLTTAVGDMENAYVDAAGRTGPTATELGAGNIGGLTISPGLYKWSTNVSIPTDVTLSGWAGDVWIFQIGGDLSIASAKKVILVGGANAANVFWQVGGPTGATLATNSIFNGTILSAKQVILQTGAALNGRALAQTQITLDHNVVTVPAPKAALRIVKLVINDWGGTSMANSFNLNVKLSGANVTGSPFTGTGTPGTMFLLSPGTYAVSESANASYSTAFSWACDGSGAVVLWANDDKTCTVTNTYVPPAVSSGGGGGGGSVKVDYCPEGDYSNGYYDGTCGTAKSGTGSTSSGTVTTPISAPASGSGTVVKPTAKPVVKPAVKSTTPVKVVRIPMPSAPVPTSVPKLPNAGLPPQTENAPWNTVSAMSALFVLVSWAFFVALRKRTVRVRKE